MQANADPQWFWQWPGLVMERHLDLSRGGYSATGLRKGGEAAVAFAARPDEYSIVVVDDAFDQRIVALGGCSHRLWMQLPER
jgi:hypothetical protein